MAIVDNTSILPGEKTIEAGTCTTVASSADVWYTVGGTYWGPLEELSIELPKKPRPAKLVEAKRREQLKAWGLRK